MPYDGKKKRKRRIMHKFKMDEISAVDRPAQSPALSVIMKRDESVDKAGDMVNALTSAEEGHQHGISINQHDDEMYVTVHYARSEDAEGGHDHQVVVNTTGDMVVSENMGHTHTIDTEAVRNIMFSCIANKRESTMPLPEINNVMDLTKALTILKSAEAKDINEIAEHVAKRAEALGMTELLPVEGEFASIFKNAADNGGGPETGEPDMSKTDTTATETAVNELKAKLAKAETFGKLTDVQKAHYTSLDDAAKEEFLAKSESEREDVVTLAKAADAVVYTTLDGEQFSKSDDPRLVAMAKRADAQTKALEKAAQREGDAVFAKRAETELSHLPGEGSTHVAILKAMDTIENEDVRKAALEVLKSNNVANESAFVTTGTMEVSKAAAGDAHAELDRLAKAHQKSQGGDFYAAYDAITKTHPELYAKAIAG